VTANNIQLYFGHNETEKEVVRLLIKDLKEITSLSRVEVVKNALLMYKNDIETKLKIRKEYSDERIDR
jgi:hypothetical protein